MFDDIEEQLNTKKVVIHRNGRQCFTIISDMAEDLDLNKISRYLKKHLIVVEMYKKMKYLVK